MHKHMEIKQCSPHLNHQWVKSIKVEIKDFLKVNENDNITYPNLWDIVKAVLRRKFIALYDNIKKLGKSHTSELTENLKTLEQKEANSPGELDSRK